MAESLITQHIDLWTSSIEAKSTAGRGSKNKFDLYGIKKLRELILELAVRGKLVPQDPSDEPAEVILQHINNQNKQLVEEGILKKVKPVPPVTENELPFEVPQGWVWARLGSLGVIASSSRVHQKDWKISGVPFYRAREIVLLSKNGIVDNELFISEELYDELTTSGFIPENNDIMLTGVGTIGIPYIVRATDRFYFKDASVLIFKNMAKLNTAFLGKYFLSLLWNSQIHEGSMGTTVHTLTIGRANDILVPLPPKAEQLRIVAKVDELMALCDQLEQQTLTSIDAHATLVETLLETLTNSADAAELEQNWARISEHFDTLFTTEQSIDALKQTILQLAVMGKLVRQDPTDEPASVLLEKIAAEKAQLIQGKKIRKQDSLPVITDEEKYFSLPEGWSWCRLDDICYNITSGSTPSKEYFTSENGIPYLKVYNIRDQLINFEYQPQFVTKECHEGKLKRSTLLPGDVVMNIVGPPLGKTAIIPDTYPEWNCNQAITFFRSIEKDINPFIYLYIRAGLFLSFIELIGTAGQDNISVTKSRTIVLPLPPLAEQVKIMEKTYQLLRSCDDLASRLKKHNQTLIYMTDAFINTAL